MPEQNNYELRSYSPPPPTGWKKIHWYSPGLLWMLSALGSGTTLFTPRVGSRYGYDFFWAALLVIFIQWVVIREIGRYTVVTGKTFLEGCKEIPGPRGWAIWLIFIPQLLAAIVTICGIASLTGSALMIAFQGSHTLYVILLLIICIFLVIRGQYKGVEKASTLLGVILIFSSLIAAILVRPSPSAMLKGLIPSIPQDFDINFIIPWLGFMLAGAAGLMWYSYWVIAKGYGGEVNEVGVNSNN
ncbi:MAG: Nramp family divalent metal transporter, partial [Oligoflexia bacterium]|nr:Nramp family divalent metal transporter [Oligoflexia bacterium]